MTETDQYFCEICHSELILDVDSGLLEGHLCKKCGKMICEHCYIETNSLCKKCGFIPPTLNKWFGVGKQ